MNNEKIGAFIKKLRQENDMSQNDLAEKIPINREAISKWECGRTIPDSSTILRLGEIFNVTADEILYGEYKTKENSKELEDVHLQIYDDRNAISKKLKKTSKILLSSLIMLVVATVVFLSYYFFNSYDSVKIYIIESKQDDIYLTDGTIMLTGENIYFRLGNINGIDENHISKVVLYYNKDDSKKIIYEGTSSKDYLIRDYYGYNEYFEIKNKDVIFDSLYVDIHYDNKVKTINLIMKEDYSNKRLFFQRDEKVSLHKAQDKTTTDSDLINIIKRNLKYEESGIYHQKIKIDKTTYDLYYIDDTSTLLIYWKEGNYNYSINYNPRYKNASYKKGDSKLNNMHECYYDENDQSKTTCNNSIINILNSIINDISKGGS